MFIASEVPNVNSFELAVCGNASLAECAWGLNWFKNSMNPTWHETWLRGCLLLNFLTTTQHLGGGGGLANVYVTYIIHVQAKIISKRSAVAITVLV